MIKEAITIFDLHPTSNAWGIAADWLEEQGCCWVSAQSLRDRMYDPRACVAWYQTWADCKMADDGPIGYYHMFHDDKILPGVNLNHADQQIKIDRFSFNTRQRWVRMDDDYGFNLHVTIREVL